MDEKASEKAVVFSVRFTLPELEALQEYADRRGSLISTAIRETMLGVVGASTAPCPEWCDGPECDHPPRVGGACAPCAKQHATTHALQSTYSAAERAARWLDVEGVGDRERIAMQVVKLSEEVGEVAEALIGMTGLNSRKGVTHTRLDVAVELGDVALTALTGIAILGMDVEKVFTTTAAKFHARADVSDESR